MNVSTEDFEGDGEEDREEPEDPRLAALVEALAKGEAVDWQQAESSAGSAEEKEQIRALAAISEVATFHRTWLAEGGITGDLDEDEDESPTDEIPTHWGELEILERVGRGSFGDVFKAREPRLDRIVALKLIRASAKTPEREAETLREGRLLAKVRHPNVATVHGAAGADGRVGFWMEFLEGKNLAEILAEKGRFEAREAAEIGIALCRALAAVHAQGIVHRDVKAQNVVRENDGRIVLTDFGVGRDTAVLQSEEPSLSGTPLYLAPELFEGKAPSPASDLYALGVLLFYLVTGEFPITGNSFDELRAAHRERKRRWLKELRKDLPGTFVGAVERALDRDPEKRSPSAADLKRQLEEFVGENAKARKRKRVLVAAVLAVAAAPIVPWIYTEARNLNRERALVSQEAQFSGGDLDGSILTLEKATRDDPRFVDGWTLLALRYQTAGRSSEWRRALAISQSLCPTNDLSIPCLRSGAHVALSELEYKRAVQGFEKVVASEPCDVTSLRQIGMIYNNLVQPEKGIKAALSAIGCAPRNTLAVGLLPLLLAEASKPNAIAVVEEARRRMPERTYLYWPEGIANLVQGKMEDAFVNFDRLAEDPEYASIGQIFKGQIRLEQGNLLDAELLLSEGLSVDKGSSDREVAQRRILLAEIAYRRGKPSEVARNLETLIADKNGLEPIEDNLKTLRVAAIVAVRSGELGLAEELSNRIHKMVSSSSLSQAIDAQVRGEIAAAEGNLDEAMSLTSDAQDLRPEPIIEASFLRMLVMQGDCDRAEKYMGNILRAPGLVYADYTVPWVEIRDAIDLVAKRCPK